ncbi:hypothetical protein K435DRAFT_800385 [Dendrothele bispora CBS 962.96]|uniref:CxC2-like cysteine cluster KDZ transposase-associated domain-containing protein n=1 Tax=Dendrothele bispora (strain CBS 962.96) TaxID=1314807 RepID=A0A4S8LU76_DENBC|nr:hypothetical protein K435DRAFT_800385 [Dendrothele bispora CBS 962.96]
MAPTRRPRNTLSVAAEKRLVNEQITSRARQLNADTGKPPPRGSASCPDPRHTVTLLSRYIWMTPDENFGKFYQFCKIGGRACHFQFFDRNVTGLTLAQDAVMTGLLADKARLGDTNRRHLLPLVATAASTTGASSTASSSEIANQPSVAPAALNTDFVSSRSSPPPSNASEWDTDLAEVTALSDWMVTVLIYQDSTNFKTYSLALRNIDGCFVLRDHQATFEAAGFETTDIIRWFTPDGVWEVLQWDELVPLYHGELIALKPQGIHVWINGHYMEFECNPPSAAASRPTKAAKEHLERIKKKQKLTPLGDSIVQVRSDGSRVLKTMAPSTPSSSHVRISVATSSPLPLPTGASPPPSPDTGTPETPPENKDNTSKPSQSTQALQELVAILPELTNLLLMHEANVEANEECSCGRGKRLLGHTSGTCRNPQKPVKFIITHSNGVHGTRVSFCECFGCGNRVHQLMRAKLFPGSAAEPISAFSFAVLKEPKLVDTIMFSHSAGSPDNVFTHLINDPYQTFLRIARLWRYLESRLRFGQVHGIDRLFPHRPPGSLMVYCPACMDPGVNIFGKWWTCPMWLRFLSFGRTPIHTTSHLPMEYAAHCNHVKVIANQGRIQNQNCAKTGAVNTQCDHVFVMATADMQNGERYANVDASTHQAFKMYGYGDGKTENHRHCVPCHDSYDANCSYWTHKGKRFATSTYLSDQKEFVVKFEHGIPDLHIKGHKDDCMVVFGTPYQWCVGHFHGETAEYYWVELNQVGGYTRQMNDGHREDTIIAHHNDWNWRKTVNMDRLAQDLEYARLQYQSKRDHLRQLSQADPRSAHWSTLSREPHLEKSGPGGQQNWVSVYHRRPQATPSLQSLLDSIAKKGETDKDPKGRLNVYEVFFRKAFDIERLQREIREIQRRNKKNPHSISFRDQEELCKRSSRLQKALDQLCLHRVEIMPEIGSTVTSAARKQTAIEDETLFLPSDFSAEDRVKFGLCSLASMEIMLRQAQANEEVDHVKSIAKSISTMLHFRTKHIRSQDPKTRSEHDIADAFVKRDRHINGYNHARAALINLGYINAKDENSPYPLLCAEDTHRLPVDIKRRTGDSKWGNGLLWTIGAASDLLAGVEPGEDLPVGLDEDLVPVSLVTPTRMTQRISGPRAKTDKTTMTTELTENIVGLDREDKEALAAADMEDAVPYDEGPTSARERRNKKKEKKYRKDSWLWSKGTRNMTADQMKEWETEGDRVQWFRAEAEMYRWMEQFEIKHAEFARVISHFRTMSSTWNSLAESHESPGHTAYAKRHAMMYKDLTEDAELRFKRVGHPEFVILAEDVLLHERVAKWREKQLEWMVSLGIHKAYLDASTHQGTPSKKP